MKYFISYDSDFPDFVCENHEGSDTRHSADGALKDLLQNKEVFASAVNYAIFEGKEVVKGESLSEKNVEKVLEEITTKQERFSVTKKRDLLMEGIIKEDEKASYMVVGVENQLYMDYTMFARTMVYDGLDYLSKRGRERKGVVTIVIYYGKKPWKAPRSVHEYLRRGGMSEELIKKFPDYYYYLISLSELTQEDRKLIGNELGTIASFLRLEKDEIKVQDFIESKEYNDLSETGKKAIWDLEGDVSMSADPIREYGDNREEKGRQEGIELGKQEGIQLGKQEGIQLGKQEGIQLGKQEGIQLGKQEGVVSGVAKSLISLMKRMNLTEKQAMDTLDIPQSERAMYSKRLSTLI